MPTSRRVCVSHMQLQRGVSTTREHHHIPAVPGGSLVCAGGLGAQLTWMTSLGSSAWLECISAAAPTRGHMSPVGDTAASVGRRALWGSQWSLQLLQPGWGDAPALPHSWQHRNPTEHPDCTLWSCGRHLAAPGGVGAKQHLSSAAPRLSSIPTHRPLGPRAAPGAAQSTAKSHGAQRGTVPPMRERSLWLRCGSRGQSPSRALVCLGAPIPSARTAKGSRGGGPNSEHPKSRARTPSPGKDLTFKGRPPNPRQQLRIPSKNPKSQEKHPNPTKEPQIPNNNSKSQARPPNPEPEPQIPRKNPRSQAGAPNPKEEPQIPSKNPESQPEQPHTAP